MAEAVKSSLPSHLRKEESGENNGFEKRHHGKTRSHMASDSLSLFHFCPLP